MKKFLITSAFALFSSALFATDGSFSTSCEFKSLSQGVAILNNCTNTDGRNVELVGTNNSPCKAQNALEKLLINIDVGDRVNLEVTRFNLSGNDGMQDRWQVMTADTSKGQEIAPIGKCNSTHIDFYTLR
ncbi:MAG: hypothetical protein H7177_16435 [Rhizobacter sp.]|nr:hypothetical protein [Bacteriovorax sp.]